MRMIFSTKVDSRPSLPCLVTQIIGIEFTLHTPVTAEPQFLTAQIDVTYPLISKVQVTELYSSSQSVRKTTVVLPAITPMPITNKPESWLLHTVRLFRALAAMIGSRDCGTLMRGAIRCA